MTKFLLFFGVFAAVSPAMAESKAPDCSKIKLSVLREMIIANNAGLTEKQIDNIASAQYRAQGCREQPLIATSALAGAAYTRGLGERNPGYYFGAEAELRNRTRFETEINS